MSDDSAKSQLDISDVGDITKQLNDGRLSRHGLRERLTALGLGFGAAFMLGLTGAQASPAPEATVALKSTNPAVNAIIGVQSADQTQTVSTPLQQLSYYNRYFRRWYNRYYHRW